MQSTVENLGDNLVRLVISIESNELDKELDAAFGRIAQEARIPGFRPGKAPRKVLEKHVGIELARKEALRTAMPEFYAEAIREHSVDVIAYPKFEVTEGAAEGDVKFEAVVEIRPTIPTPDYKNQTVTVPNPEVTDEDVEKQLDRMRSAFAELNTVERPAKNDDNILIDLHTRRAGEELEALSSDDFMYELGSEGIVPELDAKLHGAKPGDIIEFETVIPTVSENEDDKLQLRVLVKEVKEKVLPELNDEWASDASEFETVGELKADIRKRMTSVKQVNAQYAFREAVIEGLTKQITTEISDALLEMDMRRILNDLVYRLQAQGASLAQYMAATGKTEEALTAELKSQAVESVQADLALRAVAADMGFVATPDDVTEEINKVAAQLGREAEELPSQLEHADELMGLRSDIAKAKTLEWLLENVEVVDETGKPVDRSILTAKVELDDEDADEEHDHSEHDHGDDNDEDKDNA